MSRYLITITGIIQEEWYQDFIDRIDRYKMRAREVEYHREYYYTKCSFYVEDDTDELWEAHSIAALCLEGSVEEEDLIMTSWFDQLDPLASSSFLKVLVSFEG